MHGLSHLLWPFSGLHQRWSLLCKRLRLNLHFWNSGLGKRLGRLHLNWWRFGLVYSIFAGGYMSLRHQLSEFTAAIRARNPVIRKRWHWFHHLGYFTWIKSLSLQGFQLSSCFDSGLELLRLHPPFRLWGVYGFPFAGGRLILSKNSLGF